MTIKQIGGIFGRNPTFNNTTVDGTLTTSTANLDGAVTVNESGADADFRVEGDTDTHLIFADAGNDRASVGTDETQLFNQTGGNAKFVVAGSSSSTNAGANTNASIAIVNKDGTTSNTAGLHFAREDTDGAPNFAGASIVTQFGPQVTGQYPSGEIIFFTASATNSAPSEKLRILAGGGLTFNGDTAAANALDDYEEGSWSPSVGGDATYHVQDGYYVKVGTLVYVQGKIQVNVIGTGSTTTVSGLPFTAMNAAQASSGTGSCAYFGSLATSVTTLTPVANNAAATIIFGSLGAAGTAMTGVTTVFQNSARIDFSLSYRSV
jgi:hypothetical protein